MTTDTSNKRLSQQQKRDLSKGRTDQILRSSHYLGGEKFTSMDISKDLAIKSDSCRKLLNKMVVAGILLMARVGGGKCAQCIYRRNPDQSVDLPAETLKPARLMWRTRSDSQVGIPATWRPL